MTCSPGQLIELFHLRKIALDELEVFGSLKLVAAARRLIPTCNNVAGESGQNVRGPCVRREGCHAGEGTDMDPGIVMLA